MARVPGLKYILHAAIVSFVILTFAPCSSAYAQNWAVVKVSGEVWIGAQGAQPASLGSGAELPSGSFVTTGRNGRVLLERAQQRIVLSPNSLIRLPGESAETTVIQIAGKILFEVDKRDLPHFAVETPYLAAVVKGTVFTVAVDHNQAEVAVHHGRVEVTEHASGKTVDVLRDQKATVSRDATTGVFVTGAGELQPIRQGGMRAPDAGPGEAPQPPSGESAETSRSAGFRPTGSSSGHDAAARPNQAQSISQLDEESWLVIALIGLFVSHIGARHLFSIYRRGKTKGRNEPGFRF